MRKAGGVPHEFMPITLYDVEISRVQPLAGAGGCIEKVGLSFARMKKEYILPNAIGGNGGTATALIDVKGNAAR